MGGGRQATHATRRHVVGYHAGCSREPRRRRARQHKTKGEPHEVEPHRGRGRGSHRAQSDRVAGPLYLPPSEYGIAVGQRSGTREPTVPEYLDCGPTRATRTTSAPTLTALPRPNSARKGYGVLGATGDIPGTSTPGSPTPDLVHLHLPRAHPSTHLSTPMLTRAHPSTHPSTPMHTQAHPQNPLKPKTENRNREPTPEHAGSGTNTEVGRGLAAPTRNPRDTATPRIT
jgi:hypothetical protein